LGSCSGSVAVIRDGGIAVAAEQEHWGGWDADTSDPWIVGTGSTLEHRASLLYRSVVPVSAAAWLFGSGLIGLMGFARRKKA